ncbi:alanine racemase [Ruminococcaceae bacterium YRB3002]|nr:alanine racemase [Ruminococcaceae bacterium YRB3002]
MREEITADKFDRSCVEIDLDALRHNYDEIRRITSPDADVMAVVKADAYGHGAVRCARVLVEAGASYLCVATIGEAIQLREAGITARILILGYTDPLSFADVVKYDIDQAVYDYEAAKDLSDEAVKQGKDVRIHIKLDTGMGRLGFIADGSSTDEIIRICGLPGLIHYGVFSHFAVADTADDEYTYAQFDRFMSQLGDLEAKGITFEKRHICNSAGIMRFPEMHLDMVRAGIILYGLIPPGCPAAKEPVSFIPVMSWFAKVIHMKTVPVGTSVSYGRHFVASRPTKVLTVSIGYADGLSRRYSNGFELMVAGKRAPIIGNVCMDMCMLDATDVNEYVGVRSIVTVFGKHRSVDELADYLGTINYEITCIIGKRVPRIFVES